MDSRRYVLMSLYFWLQMYECIYHPRYKTCLSINLMPGQYSAYISTGIVIDNSNYDLLALMSLDDAVIRPLSRAFMVI